MAGETLGMAKKGSAEAISVLFGPQGPMTTETLLEIRKFLQENSDLDFLRKAILKLPLLWPVISGAWPKLDILPAKQRLTELREFFQGGSAPAFTQRTENILLCPLTVISHIVDFWKLSHGVGNQPTMGLDLQDVQGFCLGFLTASAISCSKNEVEYQSLVAKAVRLAVCLGAVVDLDTIQNEDCASTIAVRWKSAAHLQHLEQTLKSHPKVSNHNPMFLSC
jgi:hypothetical protein